MLTIQHTETLQTATGPMLTRIFRPKHLAAAPAVIVYSEIFQITGPIARTANLLAGLGFCCLVPEVFHELNPAGTVLAYDDAGRDKGNADKLQKPLEQHDSDTVAMLDFIAQAPYCRGGVGAFGVCIGGHLALRAALNPGVAAAFCLYPTDVHSNSLPAQPGNNTLDRLEQIKAELVLVFGRQDPHVPLEGRRRLAEAFAASGVSYEWLEFNAQHAFLRDEGERYDPELALEMYGRARGFFSRTLLQAM